MEEALRTGRDFHLECIRAILRHIPGDMPLFMRIDAHDDYLPGGLTIEEVIEFLAVLQEKMEWTLYWTCPGEISSQPVRYMRFRPLIFLRGFNVENAARIRRENEDGGPSA